MSDKHVELNNGMKMPIYGLGTSGITEEAFNSDIICNAIVELGIRHIDTAYFYKNEKEVGEGIKKAI